MNVTTAGLKSEVLMFNWTEYTIFCTMMVLSILIGIYYGWFKKQDTMAEYMLGGKNMNIFPISLSMIASHISGITLLGMPAEIYSYGTQYFGFIFSNFLLMFVVNYLYLPVFYELQLNSLYEYLELRFSRGTRTLASLIFLISLILFIPIVLYVPALAFNQVTGISVHVTTPIITVLCVFYTSFGGLKTVVWTNVLQSGFTLGSSIFIACVGVMKIGSVYDVLRINNEGGRLELFNMSLSLSERYNFWTMAVSLIFGGIPQIAVHPGAMQRFIAVPTLKAAKLVTIWYVLGFELLHVIVVFIGLILYATYHDCDLLATGMVRKTDQMLPYFVMTMAQDFPGLSGLFISGVFSAGLSTMSALLNTIAGTLYQDVVVLFLKGKELSEAKQTFVTKIIVLVVGLICVALVFILDKLGTLFQMVVSFSGITNGVLGGIFTLGLFFPRANSKGAIIGTVVSMIGMVVIGFGSQYYLAQGMLKYVPKATSIDGCPANFTSNLPFNASEKLGTFNGTGSPLMVVGTVPMIFHLSFFHFCALGTLIVLAIGIPVSYLTEAVNPKSLDPKLFSPCVRRFLPQHVSRKSVTECYKLVRTKTHSGPQDT